MSARILTIDIETSPHLAYTWGLFNQNIGLSQLVTPSRMLSFAAKWYGERKVEFHSEFNFETGELDNHAGMVQACHDLLDRADIVVHFNGKSFDVPHIEREFMLAELPPPSPFKQIDLYHAAKRARWASNKLQHVSTELGLEGKVQHEGFGLWLKVLAGDPAGWRKFRTYNRGDVVQTEKLYDRIRPWIRSHPHLGLYGDLEVDCCGKCEGEDLERRGLAYTPLGVYQQYRCKACGAWSRGKKALATVSARPVAGA